MTSSAKRIVKVWLPSAFWVGVIALESTNLGSAEHTGWILYPVLHFLFRVSHAQFADWHMVLRKTGHVIGYSILSLLLFRSWRATFPRLSTRWCLQWAVLAQLSASMVATLDEWHQSFLPSRTGTYKDVILDSAAAAAVQVLLFLFLRALNRKTQASGILPVHNSPEE